MPRFNPDGVPDQQNYLKAGTYYCVCVHAADGDDHDIKMAWQARAPAGSAGDAVMDTIRFPNPDAGYSADELQNNKGFQRTKLVCKRLGLEERWDAGEITPENLVGIEAYVTVHEVEGRKGSKHEGKVFGNVTFDGYKLATEGTVPTDLAPVSKPDSFDHGANREQGDAF